MLGKKLSLLLGYLKNRPSQVTLDITDRCNLRCPTCTKWQSTDASGEMTTREWKNALSELKQWLGLKSVAFSGGEPLLRPDLLELVEYAYSLGIKSTIITNGIMITKTKAKEILNSNLKTLAITLNGVSQGAHDYLRGADGCYDKVMRAISLLNVPDRKLRIGITTILAGTNYHEAADLIKWVKTANPDYISFQCIEEPASFHPFSTVKESISISDPEWHVSSELWFNDPPAAINAIEGIMKLKKERFPISNSLKQLNAFRLYIGNPSSVRKIRCLVGKKSFNIDPYGNVRLCFNMLPVGNIKEKDPKSLWISEEARDIKRQIDGCQLNCRLLICNFS